MNAAPSPRDASSPSGDCGATPFATVYVTIIKQEYLWVFHSSSVVHYVLDSTRAAQVIQAELAGVDQGIISCDRYSGYKRFARLNPGVVLAYCWAHQRRDFLDLANSYPDETPWALTWVDAIGQLYHLNGLRLAFQVGSVGRDATWLGAFLQACADNANHSPSDLKPFLPWTMDAKRLAAMQTCPISVAEDLNSS